MNEREKLEKQIYEKREEFWESLFKNNKAKATKKYRELEKLTRLNETKFLKKVVIISKNNGTK